MRLFRNSRLHLLVNVLFCKYCFSRLNRIQHVGEIMRTRAGLLGDASGMIRSSRIRLPRGTVRLRTRRARNDCCERGVVVDLHFTGYIRNARCNLARSDHRNILKLQIHALAHLQDHRLCGREVIYIHCIASDSNQSTSCPHGAERIMYAKSTCAAPTQNGLSQNGYGRPHQALWCTNK